MNPLLAACASYGVSILAGLVPGTEPDGAVPWELTPSSWRTDPAWYDGLAEKCVYEATRSIYGVERRYLATVYTNKQLMDPETTVKATGSEGVEVFKHHWSERVPTENYDYDFSTVSFTRTEDLAPFKLTVATQDDCGSSFKQVWRDGRRVSWFESVYFPDAGTRTGAVDEASFHFEDGLSLVLRDFPFRSEERAGPLELQLVPSQKSTRRAPFIPARFFVTYAGTEVLSLPVGDVEAHRIELSAQDGARATYWFAAEGGAPWLHALVQFEGPQGLSFRLSSIERTAYWERG